MDVFRFMNPTAPLRMEQGMIVNDLKSKMWVERYAKAGEFKFVADASVDIRNQLPIGSFVSHVDTQEVMIVENHEINEDQNSNSDIVVTGRGFETEFEQRMVGLNKTFPTSGAVADYPIAAGYVWNQAIYLINDHISVAQLIDDNNALPYVQLFTALSPTAPGMDKLPVPVWEARSVKRGNLYERVLELMAINKIGIKVVRPGLWSPLGAGSVNTAIVFHIGVDRTSQIIFSSDTGEITSAGYLWSNKANKNAALITGKWVETVVVPTEIEYDRRWMAVDASDIDQNYSAPPTGTNLTDVVTAMQQRGRQALSSQNDVALTKTEIAKNSSKAAYRKDFDVGDLITVHGSYNATSIMQISEYVEIEDETGESSYPTLELI